MYVGFKISDCIPKLTAMALASLELLCRKAKAMPADVLLLVRAYLAVHVGIRCPGWLGQMLQEKVRGNPSRGVVYRHARLLFRVCQWIDYDIYRVDFQGSTSERTALRGHPVEVDVHIWSQPLDRIFHWRLTCRQGDNMLRSCNGLCLSSDIADALKGIRSCYTETEPRGCAEIPVTWCDWRGYIRLWLFGPRAQEPQGTGCRDCGNTSIAIRMHGEAFCSQDCADSFAVLSYQCWSCRAPLNTGQKICRRCPVGLAALHRERGNAAVFSKCWGCRAPVTWAHPECLDCPEERAARGA